MLGFCGCSIVVLTPNEKTVIEKRREKCLNKQTNICKMVTKQEIFDALCDMGAPKDKVVIFHSSLRSVGEIYGGAKAFLDALIEYFTADGGLLCIPTHTWDNLGRDVPTLDMSSSHSCLGVLSRVAAEDKRGVRSLNPSHSMVVFGEREKALEFIKDDAYIDTPTSPDSCYGKLYKLSGYVFLCGVSHNKNTYLHTVEEILEIKNRMDTNYMNLSVRNTDGKISERRMRLFKCSFTDDVSFRFHKYETAFRYHRCIKDGYIGNAPCQLCSAVGMKEVMELIMQRSGDCDPLADEEPLDPRLYAK